MKNMAVILLFILTCASASQQRPGATSKKDAKLEEKAREALAKDKDFIQVKVFVDDRIATLRGTVDLLSQKLRAEDKVRRMRGVQAVKNEITLFPAALPDEVLYGRLQERLKVADFEGLKLQVHEGRVIATGTLASRRVRTKAGDIVRSTDGVKEYDDRTTTADH